MVDGADQLGLRQVEFVIAAVDEDALGVKKRAHGSVAEHGRLLQAFDKVLRHLIENTRWDEVFASYQRLLCVRLLSTELRNTILASNKVLNRSGRHA